MLSRCLFSIGHSVPVGCGLGNILGKFQLPAFTLPFNTVTSVLFLCLRHPPETTEVAAASANATDAAVILWDQVSPPDRHVSYILFIPTL